MGLPIGPRLVRLPLHAALFVACAWLASRSVTEVAAYSLAPPMPPADSTAPAPGPAPDRSWDARRIIIDRNLFGAMQVAAPQVVQEDLEPTELPLGLLGTLSASDPALARAAVWNEDLRDFEVVRVGDPVPGGGARVVRIERSRVLLSRDGKIRELVMDPHGEYRPSARRPTRPIRRKAWAAQGAKQRVQRALRRARQR